MILINHRVNTIEKLNATPKECGVEIDIMPYGNRLVLNHEPFEDGEDLDRFLAEYDHRLLILNVKSEGIEDRVLELVRLHGIKDYFFLDITFPFMVKYMKKGWTEMAARFSELETVHTALNLKGKVDWVFVDNFTRLPVEDGAFEKLKDAGFKICIVSPELFKRDEVQLTKKILHEHPADAILTDNPEAWK
ncbi:hypothetical protein KY362_06300 [Candidatus Woesearchaeota archaeon]|nr:hypothetical protein [Candidatus Woesearchaeota archaeon]